MYTIQYNTIELYCPVNGKFVCSVRVKVNKNMYVSFRVYTRRRLWSDQNQIWHTHADSSSNGSGLNKKQPYVTQGVFGGFRGSENQKSGITTKRMDQLSPNLAHLGGFIWEWT